MNTETRREKFQKAIELAGRGHSRTSIASQLKISPSTLRSWLAKGMAEDSGEYTNFYIQFTVASGQKENLVVDALYDAVADGDMQAIRFAATHLHGWGDSAMKEKIIDKMLTYLSSKLDKALFQEIVQDISDGVLDE